MTRLFRVAAPCWAATALMAAAHALAAPAAPALPASAAVDFEVFLPLRDAAGLARLLVAQQTVGSDSYHQWLTPSQFAHAFGPAPADLAKVRGALEGAGLTVTKVHSRSLHIAGSAGVVGAFFQTSLTAVPRAQGGQRTIGAAPLTLPAALKTAGVVVVAFTRLPERRPYSRLVPLESADNRTGDAGPYNYDDLKQAYNYPSYQTILPSGKRLDGTGVKVAVVMETDALDSDITAMFNEEKFTTTTGLPAPTITHLKIDGGAAFVYGSAGSLEASLDVQQVLGGAPGASVTLLSLPDLSDPEVTEAYVTIVDENTWDIVSSSFGSCELLYTAAYNSGTSYVSILNTYHELFEQGNAQGITFIASSGDDGALGCPNVNYFEGVANPRFELGVDSPADDPAVTAVGGGNLRTTPPKAGSLVSAYVSEAGNGDPEVPYDPYDFGANIPGGYWGAGGGVSTLFAEPAYQASVAAEPGRIVPDVGMLVGGCPAGLAVTPCGTFDSSVIVTFAGHRDGVIGSSVAAPEFAGAVALYVEASGQRMGNLNAFLWHAGVLQNTLGGTAAAAVDQFFHKQIVSFDGKWVKATVVPFSFVYGNGTPSVRTLFGMTNFAPAGNPQTASNP